MRYKTNGFTIVELLIVIVVIGLLAALVLNTFQGVQARARDTKDIDTVVKLARSMQAYSVSNSAYPLPTELNSESWRSANTFSDGLIKDSRDKVMNGISTTDQSLKVRAFMPLAETDGNCGAIFQIKKEENNSIYTKIIDNCPEGGGFNAVPAGSNCPTELSSVTFVAYIEDDEEGFCRPSSNIIL